MITVRLEVARAGRNVLDAPGAWKVLATPNDYDLTALPGVGYPTFDVAAVRGQ